MRGKLLTGAVCAAMAVAGCGAGVNADNTRMSRELFQDFEDLEVPSPDG